AMHDSSERDLPPSCHPKTRLKVIETIIAWIEDADPLVDILWLHAPFGYGKSAVMQTAIGILIFFGLRHLFAGAFFFGRNKPGRDLARYLFPTIAYQIAINVPGMRELIDHAMVLDPTLPSKTMEIQLCSIIIKP
ncbi:hypothetical protein CPB83DRAFT_747908, partial [Crepidotus variabilis]